MLKKAIKKKEEEDEEEEKEKEKERRKRKREEREREREKENHQPAKTMHFTIFPPTIITSTSPKSFKESVAIVFVTSFN